MTSDTLIVPISSTDSDMFSRTKAPSATPTEAEAGEEKMVESEA
jgi:hypothetical protein